MRTLAPSTEEADDLLRLDSYAERLAELHRGKTFHAKQQAVIQAIFRDGYKRVFIRKGRKGGGTHTLLYPLVRMAGCFDRMACYLIGPQYNLEREIIWNNRRLHEFIPREWKPKFKEYEARVVLPNGSFIKVQGADNYKSMVGIEGDVFVFDEMRDHDPRAYKNCYPNIASRDALWIVCGAPPPNKANFYYQLEQQIKDDPDWFFIHWSTWDNIDYLPGGEAWIKNEKEKYYKAGNWDEWETEYEARYVFGGKRTVLSGYNESRHILPFDVLEARISKDKGKLHWYSVFDPGFATCFAVAFIVYNPYTSEVYFLDEIYETDRNKLSVNDIWPRVRAIEEKLNYQGKWRRVYDCAAPGFPNEVRARWGKGFSFAPSYKEKDDEDKFFRVWNSAFSTNRCYIASHCRSTIWEVENYLTTEDGRYPDEHNHILDSGRYFFKASGWSNTEKQDDVITVSDIKRGYTIEDDLEAREKKNDWASFIHDDDLSFDDERDYNFF